MLKSFLQESTNLELLRLKKVKVVIVEKILKPSANLLNNLGRHFFSFIQTINMTIIIYISV